VVLVSIIYLIKHNCILFDFHEHNGKNITTLQRLFFIVEITGLLLGLLLVIKPRFGLFI